MVSEFFLGRILPTEMMQWLYLDGGFLVIIFIGFAGGMFLIRRGLLGEWRFRFDSIIFLIAAVICLVSAGQTIIGFQVGHPWLFLVEINPVMLNFLWMFVLPPLNPWVMLFLGGALIFIAWLNYRTTASLEIEPEQKKFNTSINQSEPYRVVLWGLTRISVWLGSLFLFILSVVLLGSPPLNSGSWIPLYDPFMWITLILGILAVCFFNSAIFIINQVGDIDTDQLHAKKAQLPVSSGRVSKNRAITIAGVLIILGIISARLVSEIFLIILSVTFVFALVYSIPPIRLKGRPFLDLMIIGLGFGTWAVLSGWALHSGVTPYYFLPELPFTLLIGAGAFYAGTHGVHTASDYAADEKAGVNTTAVYLGPNNAIRLGVTLIAVGLLFLYITVGLSTHLFWYGLLKYKTIFLLIFLGLPFFALYQQFRCWQQTRDQQQAQLSKLQHQGRLVSYLLFLVLFIYLLCYVFLFYPVYYPHYFFPWI
jgi:chlorophyll synthase